MSAIIVFIIFIGMGAFLFVTTLQGYLRRSRLREGGIETEATIISVDRNTVVYGYTVAGTYYKVTGIPLSYDRKAAGATVKIRYQVDNPEDSVFAADTGMHIAVLDIIGLVFSLGMIVLGIVVLMRGE